MPTKTDAYKFVAMDVAKLTINCQGSVSGAASMLRTLMRASDSINRTAGWDEFSADEQGSATHLIDTKEG
jgi:hypothetical protein